MEFKDALRAEMESAGISQRELAQDLRVAQPTVWAWLQGSEPGMVLYRKLTDKFPSLSARLVNGEARSA